MIREIIVLLAIAGAAYALEPAILLTEQPRMLLQPDGTQEYWLEYALAVSNPSERNELRFFIANYTLPPEFSIIETDENYTEKRKLENTGAIQTGIIRQNTSYAYYYKIIPPKPPLELNWSATGNELEIRIYNSRTTPLELKYLEPAGWTAISASAGKIEGNRIVLENERIEPEEERTLKVVSSTAPAGYRLALENPESFPGNLAVERVGTEYLLSVEKQTGESGTYAITLTYLNPTEFTQEVTELKLLKTKAPLVNLENASTVWRLENKTIVEAGGSLEFTITDHSKENPFYWYSTKANTKYNLSAEKRGLVIAVEPPRAAAPTGFAVFGLSDKNFLGNILEHVVNLLKNIF